MAIISKTVSFVGMTKCYRENATKGGNPTAFSLPCLNFSSCQLFVYVLPPNTSVCVVAYVDEVAPDTVILTLVMAPAPAIDAVEPVLKLYVPLPTLPPVGDVFVQKPSPVNTKTKLSCDFHVPTYGLLSLVLFLPPGLFPPPLLSVGLSQASTDNPSTATSAMIPRPTT